MPWDMRKSEIARFEVYGGYSGQTVRVIVCLLIVQANTPLLDLLSDVIMAGTKRIFYIARLYRVLASAWGVLCMMPFIILPVLGDTGILTADVEEKAVDGKRIVVVGGKQWPVADRPETVFITTGVEGMRSASGAYYRQPTVSWRNV